MLSFNLSLTSTYRHFQQNFIDLGKIGSGGFAHVHHVKSKLDHRQYALKILQIKPSQCKQDMIDTIHKFLDEVKTLSYLNHKNIIQYFGCWVQTETNQPKDLQLQQYKEQHNDQIVMVMDQDQDFQSNGIQFACSFQQQVNHNADHKQSKSNNKKLKVQVKIDHSEQSANIRQKYKCIKIFILSQLCQQNLQRYLYQRNLKKLQKNSLSRMSPNQQLIQNYKMIIQISQGLQYLHSKNFIHRDIKLHNIVYNKNKKCKIIDFGLAKKARMLNSISQYSSYPKDMTVDEQGFDSVFSSSVGTKIYSSPEQISSERYDHRTDIYSFAIVVLMFFADFTTTHEELTILQKIRKIDIDFIKCDPRLKILLTKCLGQQKQRPRLSQIRKVAKVLYRQQFQRQSKNTKSNQIPHFIQKDRNVYIVDNQKLKKKISRQDYEKINQNIQFQGSSRQQNGQIIV